MPFIPLRALTESVKGSWPHVGLALATLLWSGNFIVGRALRDDLGPLELNFLRWLLALMVLAPFTLGALLRQWSTLRKHPVLVLGLGLSGIAVPHACVYAALRMTSPVNALLLMSLTPLLILIGARIAFGQPIQRRQWAGVAVSTLGAGALVTHGSFQSLLALEFGLGDLWMLPAIVAAAAQALLLRRTPPGVGQGALLLASVVAALAAMLVAMLLLGATTFRLERLNHDALAGLAYVGVLASAVAFALWNRGVERIGPHRAAPYLYLMPLYGAILSFLVLDEGISGLQCVAGGLVLLGLWLSRPTRPAR